MLTVNSTEWLIQQMEFLTILKYYQRKRTVVVQNICTKKVGP